MKEAFTVAAGLLAMAAIGLLLIVWRIVDRVGEARVYSDVATWVLLVTLLVGGIVTLRVLLTGLARLAVGRNAHKAQPVERHTIERERILDGRVAAAPQIVAWPQQPGDLRQIYPDAMRAAIERATPAQIEAPHATPVELPAIDDIWAQLETLFVDDD